MSNRCWSAVLLVALCAGVNAQDVAPTRAAVTRQAGLPNSYALTADTASALLDDEMAFNALAAQVRRDTEAALRDDEIREPQAREALYVVLRNLALLRGDSQAAQAYGKQVRANASTPAARWTNSLLQDAAATAASARADQRASVYRAALRKAIELMPWTVVQENLKGLWGGASTPDAASLVRARVRSQIDSAVEASRRLSEKQASLLISSQVTLQHLSIYDKDTAAVLGAYIARHQVGKADIWPARETTLLASQALAPVRLAIWDEGVDVGLFRGRLFVNAREKVDGRDDDGNGYVDDVHGISFDEHDQPAVGPMLHFDDRYPGRETELRNLSIGHSDAQAYRFTAAANAYRQRVASLPPEQLAPLTEAIYFYDGFYSHGTHVAGIAMKGNPAARLLVVRYDSDDYHAKPSAFTDEVAQRYARNVKAIVAYLRGQKVRVVNMSFGLDLEDVERTLEANHVGATPSERTAMAAKTLDIVRSAFTEAMGGAPDILFVAAAANRNTNFGSAPDVPAGINLPNLLSVGAVDQYGDAVSFSSYGTRIGVYANGNEVDSIVPGGFHESKTGTSMAAPQVTNLAAKLFALSPSLTPAQCAALIRKGATPSADGQRALLDPANTVALLKRTHVHAGMPEITP